jgi:hypothetical protein
MARKVVDVTINDRGTNKTFVLTEMPASQAEKWATRLLLAITRAAKAGTGIEIPDNLEQLGMAGIASLGIRALSGVSWEDIEPLMDEMFRCVQIRPDPLSQPLIVRPLIEDDIEDVQTRLKLRAELIALHTGFSLPDFPSTAVPAKSIL